MDTNVILVCASKYKTPRRTVKITLKMKGIINQKVMELYS